VNLEMVNNRLSQLHLEMTGIAPTSLANGIRLSIFANTVKPFARRRLP
jgi:hypothetical protein